MVAAALLLTFSQAPAAAEPVSRAWLTSPPEAQALANALGACVSRHLSENLQFNISAERNVDGAMLVCRPHMAALQGAQRRWNEAQNYSPERLAEANRLLEGNEAQLRRQLFALLRQYEAVRLPPGWPN